MTERKMIKAVLIKADNSPMTEVECGQEARDMAAQIGCQWIELIKVPLGNLAVDEEGLWAKRPINSRATAMAGKPLVGDALLIRIDDDGDAASVDTESISKLIDGNPWKARP